MRQRHIKRGMRRHAPLVAFALGFALLLATLLPFTAGGGLLPIASAHALLVRSDPAEHAVLQAPPSQVRLWFSEAVNAATSHAVVVDTTNREVDNHDSHVNSGDATQMDVGVPLLPAGTYVVAWQTQSADDGHITSGSFYFQIARPDGSVPAVPAQLPTGHIPGAGGSSANGGADAQSLVQAVFTWLALLFMTFWAGGLIWETWIHAPGTSHDPDVAEAARAAARRFRRLATNALCLVLVADVGIVLAQAADLAGEWSGAVSPPLLRAILFGSRYGDFWWLRQLTVLAALVLFYLADRRGWQPYRAEPVRLGAESFDIPSLSATLDASLSWRREVLAALRGIPHLPGRLARGWRMRTLLGRTELLLGALLILAFALSGHAAAVPASEFAYALTVDLFHLVAEAAWVGGLFYISAVFVPALRTLTERGRARVLALGLPEFGAVAIVCAVALAATGSLSTTIHLTGIEQFLTTAYGRILAVKIEFFLFMVAISA
ncbi:MAG: copper resistance protein CopC, partial [Ktedonobacterales bacterium]